VQLPAAPDGIYLLFQQVQFPPAVLDPQSSAEAEKMSPPSLERYCLPRYIWLKNGGFTLHRRHPTLGRIELMPGVTAEFGLMQPVPQVDYSNDCRLDGHGLRLYSESWLGIHLPDQAAGMTLHLQTAIPATGKMILDVKNGNEIIHKQRFSKKNGTAHEITFTVPPGPFPKGMLKLSFKVRPQIQNRALRRDVPVQLKSITLSADTTE
jgi:hypothetical protein